MIDRDPDAVISEQRRQDIYRFIDTLHAAQFAHLPHRDFTVVTDVTFDLQVAVSEGQWWKAFGLYVMLKRLVQR